MSRNGTHERERNHASTTAGVNFDPAVNHERIGFDYSLVVGALASAAIVGGLLIAVDKASNPTVPAPYCDYIVRDAESDPSLDDIGNGRASVVDNLYFRNGNSHIIYQGLHIENLGKAACDEIVLHDGRTVQLIDDRPTQQG